MDVRPFENPLDPQRRVTRRTLLRGSAAAGMAFAIPSLLAACGGDDEGAEPAGGVDTGATATGETEAAGEPQRGGTITLAMNDGGPGEVLNPAKLPSFMEAVRAIHVYDQLFYADASNTPVGVLAEDAEPGADASVWKVTLRDGVTFHDGKPFTADDVIYSFQFYADPKNEAQQAASIGSIDPAGIKKLSDLELEFTLKEPIGDFKRYISDRGANAHIIADGTTTFDTQIGTGPFKLESFTAGQQSELVRNDDYFGNVFLDGITMVPIPDPTQRMNALLTGQANAVYFVDFTQAQANEDNSDVQIVASSANGTFTPFYVQVDAPDFSDVRVRQALKLSVDRQAMLDNALLGFGAIGNDVAGKGFPSYNEELAQREYDPEQAKALLAEAGKEGLRFTLYTSSATAGMLESATAWKEQAKAAGITIDLEKLPADSYFANDKYLKVPAYQSAWGNAFEGWAPQALFKGATYNETHYDNPQWEADFRRAVGITEDDERNAALKELQMPIWEEGGYIIWGFQANIIATSANIKGAEPWAGFNIWMRNWYIEA